MRNALGAFLAGQRGAWGLAPFPFERYSAV